MAAGERVSLVLSLFPGIGLLDMAFEEEGFCVVRGPDLLWGGDVRRFHPPAGRFDGVIGGPPCQPFSRLVNMIRANGYEPRHENLIPEFERVVCMTSPAWFVMEEVVAAPIPSVPGYVTRDYIVNNRWCGGVQERKRRISFGTPEGRALLLQFETFDPLEWEPVVAGDARRTPVKMVRGGRKSSADLPPRTLSEMCELQGLPAARFSGVPFTASALREAIGNGVPLPMGRAIAKAVCRALARPEGAPPLMAAGDQEGGR
jgi:DNA (cytosine-5)-methyltransferase 1